MSPPPPDTPAGSRPEWPWWVVAGILLAALGGAAWSQGWFEHLPDRETFVEWMRRDGLAGPLICIAIQFAQVVVFAIPGEITQVAAGYVFGAGWGFAYSLIGILLGSAFDHSFARVFGRPAVERMAGAERLAKVDRAMQSRKGHLAVFVVFLIPGAPKDLMCYATGLTPIGLGRFLALSVPARTPALLMSTVFGQQLYDRNYVATLLVAAVAAAGLALAGYYRWRQGRDDPHNAAP